MPQINSQQSYELAHPKGRRIHQINHKMQPTKDANQPSPRKTQTLPRKNQPKDITHAYSLHLEHVALQQKRNATENAARKQMQWRNNLDILRNKPRPQEIELLTNESVHHRQKKLAPLNTDGHNTDRSVVQDNIVRSQRQRNGKHTERRHDISGLSLTLKLEKENADKTAEFSVIMDPGVSSEERYEKYVKDLDLDKSMDMKTSQWSHQQSTTEQDFKDMLARESGRTGYTTTDDECEDNNNLNVHKLSHNNESTSRSPSKAPSRIGRVSSLGLDGRMSVNGMHYSDSNRKDAATMSRLSMNSSFCNYDGDKEGRKSYVYREDEIHRKMFLLSSRESGMTPLGRVEKNVKLMDYLTKNTKVIPVYDEGATKSTMKKVKQTEQKKVGDTAEAKGGGWKMMAGGSKSKRQPDFDKMIPVSVVTSCEIQTQTDSSLLPS